jgi:hypothetical protein
MAYMRPIMLLILCTIPLDLLLITADTNDNLRCRVCLKPWMTECIPVNTREPV